MLFPESNMDESKHVVSSTARGPETTPTRREGGSVDWFRPCITQRAVKGKARPPATCVTGAKGNLYAVLHYITTWSSILKSLYDKCKLQLSSNRFGWTFPWGANSTSLTHKSLQNHKITKVVKDFQVHPAQLFSCHQHFPINHVPQYNI